MRIWMVIMVYFFFGCISKKQDRYLYSNELASDAENGITYEDQFFNVVVKDINNLFKTDGDRMIAKDTMVLRGSTFYIDKNYKKREGYIAISFGDNKNYYIKNNSSFFPQEFDGMKYPLYGIVKDENCYIVMYDHEKDKNDTISLSVGSHYLYVLFKDRPYINVKNPVSKKYVTGEFSCRLSILQSGDHSLLLKKYRTRLKNILQ